MEVPKSNTYDPLKTDINNFLENINKVNDKDCKYTLEKIKKFISKLEFGIGYYETKINELQKKSTKSTELTKKIKGNQTKKDLLNAKKENLLKLKSEFESKLAEGAGVKINSNKAPAQTPIGIEKAQQALGAATTALGTVLSQAEQGKAFEAAIANNLEQGVAALKTHTSPIINKRPTPTPTPTPTTNETFLNTSGSFKLYKAGEKNFGPHFLGVLEAIGRVILLPFVAIGLLFASISNKNNSDTTHSSYKDRLDTAMKGYLGTIKNSILPPSPATAPDATNFHAGYVAQQAADDAFAAHVAAAQAPLAAARARAQVTAKTLADATYNATLAGHNTPLAAAAAAAVVAAATANDAAAAAAVVAAAAAATEATIVKKNKKN